MPDSGKSFDIKCFQGCCCCREHGGNPGGRNGIKLAQYIEKGATVMIFDILIVSLCISLVGLITYNLFFAY